MNLSKIKLVQEADKALIYSDGFKQSFTGRWIFGNAWERFGLYNKYIIVRDDGKILPVDTHAGELVPGSTEDIIEALKNFNPITKRPNAPFALDLDPTNECYSTSCGEHCFSAYYRSLNPRSAIEKVVIEEIIKEFAKNGGRIIRFDGGGDPLAHNSVKNGDMSILSSKLGLKSAILTSGDALKTTNLKRILEAGTYFRISLNAYSDKTRKLFHGNNLKISNLFFELESIAKWKSRNNISTPIGSTFLLGKLNFKEIYLCAKRARESGIEHFSVRRVLGPKKLRPDFSHEELICIEDQLQKVKNLGNNNFRVFVPWRDINEKDLDPSQNEIKAKRCWQSIFKTVIEPGENDEFRGQLCGRYRGSGFGQKMQMDPIFRGAKDGAWVNNWQSSFVNYSYSREQLISHCVSCIDRGFIESLDKIISFIDPPRNKFRIFHLYQKS